jgi:uncharacterized membrane protein (UPF0127 family)
MKYYPVVIGDTQFRLFITETIEERIKGLMDVVYLPPLDGMLFIFPTIDKVGMWMKNTRIPLDILFCDENRQIVHIVKRTTPYSLQSIYSMKDVKYAIELNGGTCDIYDIQVGQSFYFPFF